MSYDIGSFDVAQNFTNIDNEQLDNVNAVEVEGNYGGWLDGELDKIDKLTLNGQKTLELGKTFGEVTLKIDGESVTTVSTIDLTSYVIGTEIELSVNEGTKALKYSLIA